MPFDKKTELKQPEQRIELVFSSGRPRAKDELSMPPSAYIAMGWHTRDEDNRVRLTTEEMSVDAIDAQVILERSRDAWMLASPRPALASRRLTEGPCV